MSYSSAFALLTINREQSGLNRGMRRFGDGDPYTPLTGWAKKDAREGDNSSISQHNKNILAEQLDKKTEEAYNRDMADKYGKDWQSKTDPEKHGTDPAFYQKRWNELSKEEKEKMMEKYSPHLSSAERSNKERANSAEKKAADRQAAKDAVRDYVAEQKAKREEAGGTWTNNDSANARREAEQRQRQGAGSAEEKTDDESEAKTESLGNNDAADPNTNATMQDVQNGDQATLAAAKAYTDQVVAGLNCGC